MGKTTRARRSGVHERGTAAKNSNTMGILGVSLVSFELNCRQLKAVAGRKP